MASHKLFRILAVGWMGLIFIMSSRADTPTLELFWQQDKLMHVGIFGVLSALMAYSLNPPGATTWGRVILLTAIVMVYGISDEYHQSFIPGRDASLWDVLADGIGGFLAAMTLFWWNRQTVKISPYIPPDETRRA